MRQDLYSWLCRCVCVRLSMCMYVNSMCTHMHSSSESLLKMCWLQFLKYIPFIHSSSGHKCTPNTFSSCGRIIPWLSNKFRLAHSRQYIMEWNGKSASTHVLYIVRLAFPSKILLLRLLMCWYVNVLKTQLEC